MSYAYCVPIESEIRLKDLDPRGTAELNREQAESRTAELISELVELQGLLYAARQHSLLIVLQGRDTSGKDGTIRHVAGPLNPQGCRVASFKVPTPDELAHDFLWRIHAKTPALGMIKIFNRSHYEDVLVVRVRKLVPRKIWQGRYEDINNFETLLAKSRTIIVKFYLHISKEEQKKRLLAREQDRTKFWKLSVGDWKERELWNDYTKAYEDAINRCNIKSAPWFIVPADRKWLRNLAIAEVLRDTLAPYRERWLRELSEVGERELRAIQEYRESLGIVV